MDRVIALVFDEFVKDSGLGRRSKQLSPRFVDSSTYCRRAGSAVHSFKDVEDCAQRCDDRNPS